jgi:hypothetical protein
MEKMIAFNLYVRTPAGSYHTAAIGDEAKDVYLASDVHALLKSLSDARLQWSMDCHCVCPACNYLDERLRGLMVS